MNLQLTAEGSKDDRHWQDQDRQMTARVNALRSDIVRDPFRGIGKPEPHKNELAGWWSRWITAEHRLICRCRGSGTNRHIEVAQCHDHY